MEFKSCPLQYRLRSIDRLPERPSAAAARGTVVHAVLEQLFDLAPAERTPDAAIALLPVAWQQVRDAEPELAELFDDEAQVAEWLESAEGLLRTYFALEDPSAIEPLAREHRVEAVLGDVLLRGVIDRVDGVDAAGLRVVDYKSGHSPGVPGEAAAMFQLKFYALLLWRARGVVPELRLMYLTDATTLAYRPDAVELERFEGVLLAIWDAIRAALPTGDFRPNPSARCRWCDFTAHCPVFGATPPPYRAPQVLTDPRDAPGAPLSVPAAAAGSPSPPA